LLTCSGHRVADSTVASAASNNIHIGDLEMPQGIVAYWRPDNFGFLTPDDGGSDLFVHISTVKLAGLGGLEKGQRVEYDVAPNRNDASKSRAVNLRTAA
jgi:CspA family cold shock protein